VKERPILFSAPMVRAILDGRKTQTRRLATGRGNSYGERGDRLWVRETWAHDGPSLDAVRTAHEDAMASLGYGPYYRATEVAPDTLRWRPSIHMPRWASRITLEVTDVRVQRLHEITEEDAIAEGARRFDDIPDPHPYGQGNRWSMFEPTTTDVCLRSARFAFANAWNVIHGGAKWNCTGKPDPWSGNPTVWAISFRVATP
jgi:hypothetical protein